MDNCNKNNRKIAGRLREKGLCLNEELVLILGS
jgi:hypothetical protein